MIANDVEVKVTGKIFKIASIKSDGYRDINDPLNYIESIKKSIINADIFTFTQKPPEITPKYKYHFEWENYAVIKIKSYDHWWKKQTTKNNRKRVKKSRNRGIIVKVTGFDDKLIKRIVDIYNEFPIRQGRKFWHYGKDFETVKIENSSFIDRSDFICAYFNNELIGFIKQVYTADCAVIMQIISKLKFRDKFVNNALIAKSVELCAIKNISYLIYSQFTYGKKGEDSLTVFKSRNGFKRLDLPRYFIPLTIKGKIAIRLKAYRNMSDILPKTLIILFLKMRAKWYKLRYKLPSS